MSIEMNTMCRNLAFGTLVCVAFNLAVIAAPPKVDPAEEISEIPPMPQTPAAVDELLYARPFKLENGYEFEWRADHPTVKAGWLVVLKVNTALVFPRQTAEPILYVGNTTAERVNVGHQSGRIVVIVPSELDKDGNIKLDLSKSPMWFGTPGLPEQVDADRIEIEQSLARRAKIEPVSAEMIEAAREQGGALLESSTRESLRKSAAELIKAYSPQESQLIDSILADDAAMQASQGAANI
jgi:hypothetical protein